MWFKRINCKIERPTRVLHDDVGSEGRYFLGTYRLPYLSILRKQNQAQVGGEDGSMESDSASILYFRWSRLP